MRICWIGFGEAGSAFAAGTAGSAVAFDRRNDPKMRSSMSEAGVTRCDSNATAVAGSPLILSVVTADQALAAAVETARTQLNGALFCDMNSVAPETKRVAARAITASGGRYVDVAIMSPVHPKGLSAPLLVAGPHAAAAATALGKAGFNSIAIAGDRIGGASAVKMIRSVIVKGIEALSAECALAADAEGVVDQVAASLDASRTDADWLARFDYNLDRMLVHGLRRAAEMQEVVKTLDGLGTGSTMSRATAELQRQIGALRIAPRRTLAEKLDVLRKAT